MAIGTSLTDKEITYLMNGIKLVDYFNKEGFAKVQRSDNLCNFINANGKILSDEWFEWVDDFNDGFTVVKRANGEWAKIDKTGKLIKFAIGYGKGLFRYNGKW